MHHSIEEAAAYLKRKGFSGATTGVVLGTGLGKFLSKVNILQKVSYKDIPNFPVATMEFHAGNLLLVETGGHKVIVMQGRFHYYEGYDMKEITFPIRVMHELGIKQLLISNAAGGVNLSFKKGDLVLIEDHINLQTANPLTGPNLDSLGPRFPDMSMPYNPDMARQFKAIAQEKGTVVKEGVYAAVTGPNLETRAEYRYLKIIGADLVGMSTVPEVIVANHMSLPVLAVSVVTDECDPDNLQPVNIEEIIEVAGQADEALSELFVGFICK